MTATHYSTHHAGELASSVADSAPVYVLSCRRLLPGSVSLWRPDLGGTWAEVHQEAQTWEGGAVEWVPMSAQLRAGCGRKYDFLIQEFPPAPVTGSVFVLMIEGPRALPPRVIWAGTRLEDVQAHAEQLYGEPLAWESGGAWTTAAAGRRRCQYLIREWWRLP